MNMSAPSASSAAQQLGPMLASVTELATIRDHRHQPFAAGLVLLSLRKRCKATKTPFLKFLETALPTIPQKVCYRILEYGKTAPEFSGVPPDTPLPNARQLRALISAPLADRRSLWNVALYDSGNPTARAVHELVKATRPEKKSATRSNRVRELRTQTP